MVSIKRILCPTDFSEFSERALTYAVGLASRFKAKLYVQHVIEDVLVLTPDIYATHLQAPQREVMSEHDIVTRLRQRLGQEKELFYNPIIVRGRPQEEILNAAKEHKIDLIVMGTHGRSGLERLVIGSVTEHVVKKAPCPVLTACHMMEEELRRHLDFRTILAAVDFSEYSLRALEYALALGEEFQSALYVLHVIERVPEPEVLTRQFGPSPYDGQYVAAVREKLDRIVPQDFQAHYRVEKLVKTGSPRRAIIDTASDVHADLVVMGSIGHGALKSALFGSTAYRVTSKAPCPVLTVRGY